MKFSVACGDPSSAPTPTVSPEPDFAKLTAARTFARYVALGTSNSMGVQSAGVVASGQKAAWPALLASGAGAQFSLPLIQDPGCPPRLLSPFAANLALVG